MQVIQKHQILVPKRCECESLHCHHGDCQCPEYTQKYYSIDDFALLALCDRCKAHYRKVSRA
jgi:hypothetical protein